ncbi:MFS transporter [Chitinimonas lacunae]|uniref:MFS transporter n=1 Tax=Chitinimonas lacunae TaxID=1963018 RepID=A0ABV8MMX5_9NEIS
MGQKTLSSGQAVALVGAMQFVYILDFMMVMPLGPDLAKALGVAPDRLPWMSAAYTAAAVLSGLLSIRLLDRFDRKPAVLLTFGLLAVATVAGAWAVDQWTLFIARALTGLFGGPALALGMAIVIDSTPPQERGQAISRTMLGFSVAAIGGVPLALELARLGGWTLPFYAVAAMAALVWLALALILPSMREHMGRDAAVSPRTLLARPAVQAACLVQGLTQFSAFLVIPNFSAYFLLNLGYPREHLGMLYFVGGITAMVTMLGLGRLVDRAGPFPGLLLTTISVAVGMTPLFGLHVLPLMLAFMMFMAGNAGRGVTLAAVTSQVPQPYERAGFMSLQGLVQNLAIALASVVSSQLLTTLSDGKLGNMPTVAFLTVLCSLGVLGALSLLTRRIGQTVAA